MNAKQPSNPLLEAALQYAERGLPILPVRPNGKEAILKDWPHQASTDTEQIRSWWSATPKANIGILTGKRSKLIVIDSDEKNGVSGRKSIREAGLDMPKTWAVKTPNGGLHYYYQYPAGHSIGSPTAVLDGVDIRGIGGYVVAPPSVHNGEVYVSEPYTEIAPLPLQWVGQLTKRQEQPVYNENSPILEGRRNETIFKLACSMRQKGISVGAIAAALSVENEKRCNPPLDQKELTTIAESAGKYLVGAIDFDEVMSLARGLSSIRDDDMGEAVENTVVAATHLPSVKKRLIHLEIKKHTGIPLKTLADEEHNNRKSQEPEPDDGTLALQLASTIGQANILAAESFVWIWSETGVWKPLASRAVKQKVQHFVSGKVESVTKYRVDSVADLLKSEVFRPDHQFNTGPAESVNVTNGELILRNAEWHLQPHVREHYRTTQIPVEWHPEAKAPRFTQFLIEVFKDEPDADEKAWALLEMIGYTLMAHCRHERFIILVGTGANGKSVLLHVLERLCGRPNVSGVQPSEFGNRFQRAYLHGKLANIVSELRQGSVIDDEALKGITSGELTTVERKHKDPFDLHPFATCWFGTNHLPHTRDFSDALFRRALVIEFNHQFKTEIGNCDPTLKDKLIGELEGILWMALNAYKRALVRGFTMPTSCTEASRKWRLEADQIAQFVQECCVKNLNGSEAASHLYDRYRIWAGDCGINNRVGHVTFRHRLTSLGFGKKATAAANMVTGLVLKS